MINLNSKLQSQNPIFDHSLDHLPTNQTHRDVLTKYEKIPTFIFQESSDASIEVAKEIRNLIICTQKEGKMCVLGLATGSTQLGIYAELVRMHKEEALSFRNVVTFNLDEYYPLSSHSIHSYHQYMRLNLFNHVDILHENIHIPDGTILLDEVHDYCREYEKKIEYAGGIDLLLLGIGRSGHIGFNEPGSGRNTKTRIITLDPITRQEEAVQFRGFENVPRSAITIGISTMLNAKKIILAAFGETKAKVVKQMVEDDTSSQVPASYIQLHSNAKVILDNGAALHLIRMKTPWLLDSMDWTEDRLIRKAVLWLCLKTNKPLLKLTGKDYNDLEAISSEEFYVKGTPTGVWKTYYDDGKLLEECPYKNGKKDGVCKQYFTDGTLKSEVNFQNGKYEGPAHFLLPGGKPLLTGQFKNDLKEGLWTAYKDNGDKESEITYFAGEISEEKFYDKAREEELHNEVKAIPE